MLCRMKRRRRALYLLLFLGISLLGVTQISFDTSSNSDVNQRNEAIRGKYSAARDMRSPRDIHIVIGYYQGNSVPWVHSENLTEEILNMNMFNPDSKAGQNGEAVIIPSFEAPKMNKLFQVNRYNLMASDRIPLNRTLPDVRRKQCQDLIYVDHLPTTSIIIVFHNEAWSTLLRTIHSVINRSPREALEEIILVDDASQRKFLMSSLDSHVATLPVPVRIIRSKNRIGLIKARLLGAKQSRGEVLTFLDAHCECTEGWLQPLLSRIHEKRNAIVSPVIDIINDETFQYVRSFELHQGGVNWELHFRWFSLPADLIAQRQPNPTRPFRTPVMAGGLFAIEKKFFYHLGSYDEKMEIWGGENIEISFRGWMCGAVLEILPCSHVAHLFRKSSPYTFPGGVGDILHANLARVALVWMDEWKNFYFKIHPEVAARAVNQSVSSRLDLRQRLKCKSFEWYLENIWPSNFFPAHNRFVGKIRNAKLRKCLESPKAKSFSQPYGQATLQTCILELYPPQMFIITSDGYVKTDDSVCLDAPEHKSTESDVRIMACNTLDRQRWKYKKEFKQLMHIPSDKCLDLPSKKSGTSLTLRKCESGSESQEWLLEEVDWAKEDT